MSSSSEIVIAQESLLRRGAHAGNSALVADLLTQGTPVDAPQEDGCTALWLASEKGYSTIVQMLCQFGADVNAAKYAGNVTPLYIASQNGHIDVVRILTLHGASVDQPKTTGATPLFIAAQQNLYEIVQLLLDAGANVEHRNHMGITPLMIASYQGNSPTVHLLLRYGADPQAIGGGRTAFEWAEASNNNSLRQVFQAYQDGKILGMAGMAHSLETSAESRAYMSNHKSAVLGEITTPARGAAALRNKELFEIQSTPNAFGYVQSNRGTPRKNEMQDSSAPLTASLFTTRILAKNGSTPPSPHFDVIPGYFDKGGLTSMHVYLEKTQQKYFHSACHLDHKLDNTTSKNKPESAPTTCLNRRPRAIEQEWEAYKMNVSSREQAIENRKYEVDDTWLHSWGHCLEKVQHTNRLRGEEYERLRREKEARPVPTVPSGMIPPVLHPEKQKDLRSFLKNGLGAKPPPSKETKA